MSRPARGAALAAALLAGCAPGTTEPRYGDGRGREWELLFESRQHPTPTLMAYDVGSGTARTIPTGGLPAGDPSASPDGARIAFVSRRPGEQSDIWVVNADATSETQLTAGSARDESPAWSPDGSTLAFARTIGTTTGIWLIDADGSNLRPLSSGGGRSG